jgi:hypothetical protein
MPVFADAGAAKLTSAGDQGVHLLRGSAYGVERADGRNLCSCRRRSSSPRAFARSIKFTVRLQASRREIACCIHHHGLPRIRHRAARRPAAGGTATAPVLRPRRPEPKGRTARMARLEAGDADAEQLITGDSFPSN